MYIFREKGNESRDKCRRSRVSESYEGEVEERDERIGESRDDRYRETEGRSR
jgi:hypothetical protein